jgi:hypothetical protein
MENGNDIPDHRTRTDIRSAGSTTSSLTAATGTMRDNAVTTSRRTIATGTTGSALIATIRKVIGIPAVGLDPDPDPDHG